MPTELDDLDEIELFARREGNRGARVLRNAVKRTQARGATTPKWLKSLRSSKGQSAMRNAKVNR